MLNYIRVPYLLKTKKFENYVNECEEQILDFGNPKIWSKDYLLVITGLFDNLSQGFLYLNYTDTKVIF